MAINSVNYGASLLSQSALNLKNQMTVLQSQLTTGTKSTTYAGMGTNEGFAVAARAQLANISAFGDTMTNINTTIGVANTALQALVNIGGQVQRSAATTPQDLNSSGQTIAQLNAQAELSSMVGILNTQAGDRYVFSGSAINTPPVVSADDILNGTGTQAGLKQLISERKQADGIGGLGRLVISSPTPTSVAVGEDVAGSPFGLKLNSVTSSLTGATVTGPSGSPSTVSIALGASNPNPGDQVNFVFNLPDGTTESIQLTASSVTPPPTGSFTIGATPTATAANLNAALNSSIGKLANTSLVAASAIAAGDNFFDKPPLRVGTTPLGSATTLVPGTTVNTVSWYTGNSGPGSARASSTARIDQSVTVQYGAQADEQAIRSQLQSIAIFAAVTTSPTGTNSAAQVAALSARTSTNLTPQTGQQTIADIQSDFAVAQTTMKDATARQTQTKSMLQALVDQTENISTEEVASQLLALQNSLQASYQTTAMLSQLTLTKYL